MKKRKGFGLQQAFKTKGGSGAAGGFGRKMKKKGKK